MEKYEKYLLELERKRKPVPDSFLLEVGKEGDAFFDYLSNKLNNDELTASQIVNAMGVLFGMVKEYCTNRKVELFNLALFKCLDDNVEIRSYASIIATRLIVYAESVPEEDLHEISRARASDAISGAVNKGLMDETLSYIKEKWE